QRGAADPPRFRGHLRRRAEPHHRDPRRAALRIHRGRLAGRPRSRDPLGRPGAAADRLGALRGPRRRRGRGWGGGRDGGEMVRGVGFAGSLAVLRRMALEPPSRLRILLGYAGWGPGQLESELAQGAWLVAPADASVLFETDVDA